MVNLAAALAGIVAAYLVYRWRTREVKANPDMVKLAARMACMQQYFVVRVQWRLGGAALFLQTADAHRTRYRIEINGAHPDYAAVMALKKLDRIGFSFHEPPLRGLPPQEECSYLRLN